MPKLTAEARAKYLTQIKGTDQYEVEQKWMQEFYDAMDKVVDDSDDYGEKEKDIQKMQDELFDVMYRTKEHDPKTLIKYNAKEVEEKLKSYDKVVADYRKKYGDKDFPDFFKKYDEQGVGYDLGEKKEEDKEKSPVQIAEEVGKDLDDAINKLGEKLNAPFELDKNGNLQPTQEFIDSVQKNFDEIDKKNGEKIEKSEKKDPVVSSESVASTEPETAEAKTASEWIRDIQNKVDKTHIITPEELARIVACRQLSDSERGSKSRLVKTTLTNEQIDQRAAELLSSAAFDEYVNKKMPKLKVEQVTEGHGGQIEDDITEFIRAREDCQDLDPKLFGRYQFKTAYKTYDDFIKSNVRKDKEMNLQYLDNMLEVEDDKTKAAKLLAAATIKEKYPNAKFNPETLNEKARELLKDTTFKMTIKNKNALDSVLKGDFISFSDEMGKVQEAFKNPKNAHGYIRTQVNAHLNAMKGIKSTPEVDPDKAFVGSEKDVDTGDKYLAKRSQKYQRMVKNAEKLLNTTFPKEKDAMKAVNAILDYQNGKEGGSLFKARNQRFDQSMQLLADITVGTPAEKYLKQQIDKVNAARGKQPGDAGYYSLETYKNNTFKSVKTEDKLEQKVNEAGDIGLGGPMN